MKSQTIALLCGILSIGFACTAQWLTEESGQVLAGPSLFLLALIMFCFALALWPDKRREIDQAGVRPRTAPRRRSRLVTSTRSRRVLFLLSLLLLGTAYLQFEGNEFLPSAVYPWLLGLLSWSLASAERPDWARVLRQRLRRARQDGAWRAEIKPHHLAFLAILCVALFFRFYRLDSVPFEMGSDHAEKLLDVNDVLHGARPIFFPRNTGREAMQFYITALLIRWTPLPLGHLALKVGTSLVSMGAVIATYFLGKVLYDRKVGLIASLLLATSGWHIAISRVGLRFPFTATFATPTIYFLVRAFRTDSRNDWMMAGAFLGIGLHTYIPMRVVPLLVVLLVLVKAVLDLSGNRAGEPEFKEPPALRARYWGGAILTGATSFAWFLPLFRYMVERPDMFWLRVTTRSSDALGTLSRQELWVTFWQNVKDALLMFNVRGDVVYVNTVPGSPLLNAATGGLFVLGLGYLIIRLLWYKDRRTLYLLLCIGILMLPSIMSLAFPGENPSAVRAGGVIPFAMIVASLPIWAFWRRVAAMPLPAARVAGVIALIVIVALSTIETYHWYFSRYDLQYRLSIWNTREMGSVVRGFSESVGSLEHAYHVPYPHWADTRAIAVVAGDIRWMRNAILDLPAALVLHSEDPAAKLYLLHPADDVSRDQLLSVFPSGTLIEYQSYLADDKNFLIFFVPIASGRIDGALNQ